MKYLRSLLVIHTNCLQHRFQTVPKSKVSVKDKDTVHRSEEEGEDEEEDKESEE